MTLINDYAPLLLRIALVILFPFSGLDKIINWQAASKQAGNIPFKPALLVISIIVEFVTPICIVTGWHDHLAAFILAGFCVVTAVLFTSSGASPISGASRKARGWNISGSS
jgi:putative oxidoreductase